MRGIEGASLSLSFLESPGLIMLSSSQKMKLGGGGSLWRRLPKDCSFESSLMC